ncbi:MAG: succinylglutamate desuccinylase/aspartoacylase family protein [Alphaproteobacteria bacterium]|nr:succinylglutamate desuccinylase/aspartoacylase family protein [Alphaproteobacteria bacterium]
MIETVSFANEETEGPCLLILGAIHGNEKCGAEAIRRIVPEIRSGAVALTRGRVTFVPVANPRAYAQDVRFTERNLNRFLVPMEKPDCYEAKIGNLLCPLLADCDFLLDLHSYSVGGPPFIFIGEGDEKGRVFAAGLGEHAQLTGWASAYAASGHGEGKLTDESTGTTEYARRFGATSVTLECGQHRDPQAPDVAYRAIRNALRYLGMTGETASQTTANAARLITVRRVYYREDNGAFAKPWKHLDTVAAGETVGHDAKGIAVTAPGDGYIVMPHADAPVGEEWFYFGTAD